MHVFFPRLLAAGLLGFAAIGAAAQQGTSADEIVNAGLQALVQIDADRVGDLWEAAPAFVKTKVSKEGFVNGIRRGRQTVGTVGRRDWASVTRIQYGSDSVEPPAGLYANVEYTVHQSDGRTAMEALSLKQEPNGWRLIGYVSRQQQ